METRNAAPLASYIDLLLDAVCAVDVDGRFVFVSAACERIFGYTPEELVGRSMIELVYPADRARTLEAAREIMAGQAKPSFENRYVRKDGSVVYIMWSARWSEVDQLRIAVARDVTESKLAQSKQAALYAISEAAHGAEDLLTLFKRIHQILGEWLPASNFSVALYNEAEDELSFPYHVDDREPQPQLPGTATGSICAEVIRSGQPLLLTPGNHGALTDVLKAFSGHETTCWLGVPLNALTGTVGVLLVKSAPGDARYTKQDQELLQYVCAQVTAAIERKLLLARLQHMAQYDQLTLLPNRALLHERLHSALARARREGGRLALLYVDLDHFKQVNDTFGHGIGDLLLQEVAHRLTACVRETDTVARIGGDEFVILLDSVQRPEDAAVVAANVERSLLPALNLEGHCLTIQASIGVALYPEHGTEEKPLFKHADEAMYGVKRARRSEVMTPQV